MPRRTKLTCKCGHYLTSCGRRGSVPHKAKGCPLEHSRVGATRPTSTLAQGRGHTESDAHQRIVPCSLLACRIGALYEMTAPCDSCTQARREVGCSFRRSDGRGSRARAGRGGRPARQHAHNRTHRQARQRNSMQRNLTRCEHDQARKPACGSIPVLSRARSQRRQACPPLGQSGRRTW